MHKTGQNYFAWCGLMRSLSFAGTRSTESLLHWMQLLHFLREVSGMISSARCIDLYRGRVISTLEFHRLRRTLSFSRSSSVFYRHRYIYTTNVTDLRCCIMYQLCTCISTGKYLHVRDSYVLYSQGTTWDLFLPLSGW